MKSNLLLSIVLTLLLSSCSRRIPYGRNAEKYPYEAIKMEPIWDYKPSAFTYICAGSLLGAGLYFTHNSGLGAYGYALSIPPPLFLLSYASGGKAKQFLQLNGVSHKSPDVQPKDYNEWLTKSNRKNNLDLVFAEEKDNYVVVVPSNQLNNYLDYKRQLEEAQMASTSWTFKDYLIAGASLYVIYQGVKYIFKPGNNYNSDTSTTKLIDGQLVEDKFCDYYLCLSYTCNTTGKMVRIRKVSQSGDNYEVGVDSNLERAYSFQNARDLAIKQTNCK